jgi:cysteine dioxygenase
MIHINDLKHFQQGKYTRNLVLKTPNIEIILVCWLPGQASPVHDHGKSDAVHVILEGEMSYTNIFPDGRKVSGTLVQGNIDHVPAGVAHIISNQSDKELVTLNIYAPPLQSELKSFDLGYSNDVTIQEVHLPEEVIQILMADPRCTNGVRQAMEVPFEI